MIQLGRYANKMNDGPPRLPRVKPGQRLESPEMVVAYYYRGVPWVAWSESSIILVAPLPQVPEREREKGEQQLKELGVSPCLGKVDGQPSIVIPIGPTPDCSFTPPV